MSKIKDIIDLWGWEPFTEKSWISKELGLKISIVKYQSINSGDYYFGVELSEKNPSCGIDTAYGWIWTESKDAKNIEEAKKIAKRWMKKLTKERENYEMGQ